MPRTDLVLEAGKLRHRVDVVAPTLAQDPNGGIIITDDVVIAVRVPCAIESLTGRELEAARTIVAEATHKLTVRWQPGIRAYHNVRWHISGGAEYERFMQIAWLPEPPDGKRHILTAICVERQSTPPATPPAV